MVLVKNASEWGKKTYWRMDFFEGAVRSKSIFFCANVIDFCSRCSFMSLDGAVLYAPISFILFYLYFIYLCIIADNAPGCNLQLLQAETAWTKAMKCFAPFHYGSNSVYGYGILLLCPASFTADGTAEASHEQPAARAASNRNQIHNLKLADYK